MLLIHFLHFEGDEIGDQGASSLAVVHSRGGYDDSRLGYDDSRRGGAQCVVVSFKARGTCRTVFWTSDVHQHFP